MIIIKISDYINQCPTLKAKIEAIEAIQAALLTNALTSVQSGESISQYSLNDGQTIISASYKNSSEVLADYEKYERLKNLLIAQKSPRVVRLVDSKSFPNGW